MTSRPCPGGWSPIHARMFIACQECLYIAYEQQLHTSVMKSRNVLTLPDVMLTSHSIPQACWNVIIEHPFWGAAEQVVVLYVPRPFPFPRSGYGW